MSTPPTEAGPKLAAFLQAEADALGTTRGAWCRSARLPDSTVIRWSQGAEPDMRNLLQVVEALPGRDLLDLLVVMEYIDPGAVAKRPVEMRPVIDVDVAIAKDPTLGAKERKLLQGVRELFAEVATSATTGRRLRG